LHEDEVAVGEVFEAAGIAGPGGDSLAPRRILNPDFSMPING
jgi:hypothetical protein